MDTLFWTQSNPDIKLEYTTKKFFGKYLYKLVVYAPAGRCLEKGWQNLEATIKHRKEISDKHLNWGGYWATTQKKNLDSMDVEFLRAIGKLKEDLHTMRFRVEEPNIAMYGETLQELQDAVTTYFSVDQYKYLKSISYPESVESAEELNKGAILRKKDYGYKYKVIFKDGKYSSDVKQTILNYILTLDETHITRGCREQLEKPFMYTWNVFFYTNDPDVVHFINLIAPGSVSNMHELVVLSNK